MREELGRMCNEEIPTIFLEGSKKTGKRFNKDIRLLGPESTPGYLELAAVQIA
jgi:hypothetical protein